MADKYDDKDIKFIEGEFRNISYHLTKIDNELFIEENYKVHPIIQVKRIKLPKDGENWSILVNGKKALLLHGVEMTKKEREFLHTSDGIIWLMNEFKGGNITWGLLKPKLKLQFKK